MVRNFLTAESRGNNPLLSRTFIFAFVAATIAIVSLLCGNKKRRRPPPSHNRPVKLDENTGSLLVNDLTSKAAYVKIEDKNDHDHDPPQPEPTVPKENKELPIPPRLANLRASSYHVGSSSNTSQRAKLTSSMSMRLSGGLKGFKKLGSKKHEDGHDKQQDVEALTREDSVWKKTIILGEKCRIPDEDEDDIIYDENGRQISTFHRKQSGLSISRQSSGINQDAIHKQHQNR